MIKVDNIIKTKTTKALELLNSVLGCAHLQRIYHIIGVVVHIKGMEFQYMITMMVNKVTVQLMPGEDFGKFPHILGVLLKLN